MQKIKVKELKEHPMNTFYFDNMSGEKWKEFLKSVETSGVIEPIIVNQEKTIISGHQRYRACIELGIEEVLCDIRIYDSEQQELKDLIETNIRQRGDISSSSLKMGRIIRTLEECYGVQHGGDRKSSCPMDSLKSQKDIAKELGVNQSTYMRNKKLLELIPELQELFEQGKISASVGSRILARLSPEEQREVLDNLGVDGLSEKTQAQLKEYVSKIQEKEKENEQLKKALEIEKNKPKEKEIVIEQDIATKEELKIVQQEKITLLRELERLRKEVFEKNNIENTQQDKARKELENKIKKLEDEIKHRDEVIKANEEIIEHTKDMIENERKLQESYKEGYDKYNEMVGVACDYQSSSDSIGKQVGDGIDITRYLIDIEKMLKDDLAPLKYERCLRDIGSNEVVKNNVNTLIGLVREWADEIDTMVNGTPYKANYGTSNNFVEGIIIDK